MNLISSRWIPDQVRDNAVLVRNRTVYNKCLSNRHSGLRAGVQKLIQLSGDTLYDSEYETDPRPPIYDANIAFEEDDEEVVWEETSAVIPTPNTPPASA